ncbi:MAG: BREX system serine/threonine kinase PglW, partial [Planctomycetaceae bacterium]|nr:BREX system serine/threonine kinase PglW [Planctomycetaceae bacterium]
NLSVDLLADRLLKTGGRDGDTFQRSVRLLLGLDPELTDCWPSQATIAEVVNVTRGRIGQVVGKLHERWAKDAALNRLRSDLAEMISCQGGVMSAREMSETLLVARGSSQDDPLRTQLARAVVRAGVEVERSMAEPRFLVRRDQDSVLIATSTDVANYARRLGAEADIIADEDPLLAPSRVIERLREVAAPASVSLPDARLVRLAAEVSAHAAVSSRQELYPRGMDAARALKLSQGALLGQRMLTVEQICDRVSGRYPDAAALPGRTDLDDLLRAAGIDLIWDEKAKNGAGCYVSPLRDLVSVTSGSQSIDRRNTKRGRGEAGEVTPEEADARQFEERLQRSLSEGSFLALTVHPKYYDRARSELCRRFPLQLIDFEGIFLDSLQATASGAKVKWDLVLQTDTKPKHGDWDKLMMLVGRAMPNVEQQLLNTDKTMLVVYPGLLARYDQMDLLSRLSQKVGRDDGIPGLWLLLPGDKQAMIDGKPVPLIGPGQRTRIPESWLQNLHRSNGAMEQTREATND